MLYPHDCSCDAWRAPELYSTCEGVREVRGEVVTVEAERWGDVSGPVGAGEYE